MMLPPAPDTDLLDRYLADECTPDERARVEAWAELPEHAGRLAALRRVVSDPFGPVSFAAPGEIQRRVWKGVDAVKRDGSAAAHVIAHPTARPAVLSPAGRAVAPRWWPALAMGAVAAVAVAAVGWRREVFRSPTSPAAMSTYTTTNGERATITLPDGSTVMLNVASRLEVPADYTAGNHTVRLTGEALFSVWHHDGVPFTVLAGGTTTRVLGTTFIVRHYPTDTSSLVAVRDGKVAVHAGAIQSAVLTASRCMEVGPRGVARLGVADAAMFDFTSGVLTIHSTPLGQAIVELDRWYAADVRLGDSSFTHVPIEGMFTAGSLSDLANVLELMLHARVVRNGRVLTLYPKVR